MSNWLIHPARVVHSDRLQISPPPACSCIVVSVAGHWSFAKCCSARTCPCDCHQRNGMHQRLRLTIGNSQRGVEGQGGGVCGWLVLFVGSAFHPTHGSHRAPHTTHPHHKVKSPARARDPRSTGHGEGHWTRASVNGAPRTHETGLVLKWPRVVLKTLAFLNTNGARALSRGVETFASVLLNDSRAK